MVRSWYSLITLLSLGNPSPALPVPTFLSYIKKQTDRIQYWETNPLQCHMKWTSSQLASWSSTKRCQLIQWLVNPIQPSSKSWSYFYWLFSKRTFDQNVISNYPHGGFESLRQLHVAVQAMVRYLQRLSLCLRIVLSYSVYPAFVPKVIYALSSI